MTITNGGDYAGNLSIAISGGNGDNFYFRVYNYTQATQMGYKLGATTTGASEYTIVSLPLYLEVNGGDTLAVQVTNTTNNDDPTIRSGVFYLHYLHE
jgi:hypothetical protein